MSEFTLGSSLLTILLPVKLALLQPPPARRLRPTSERELSNGAGDVPTLGPGAEHRAVNSELKTVFGVHVSQPNNIEADCQNDQSVSHYCPEHKYSRLLLLG